MNIKEIKPTTGAQVTIVYWPGKCSVQGSPVPARHGLARPCRAVPRQQKKI